MEVTALKDAQHFADRIFAERGVRYGRVALIPTSAKTKRGPKGYLTIETPVIVCPFRVIFRTRRAQVRGPLYPDVRTSNGMPTGKFTPINCMGSGATHDRERISRTREARSIVCLTSLSLNRFLVFS
jgi:hypothetical protein